jgi:hypothetical protein
MKSLIEEFSHERKLFLLRCTVSVVPHLAMMPQDMGHPEFTESVKRTGPDVEDDSLVLRSDVLHQRFEKERLRRRRWRTRW